MGSDGIISEGSLLRPAVDLPGAAYPYLAPCNSIYLLIVIVLVIEYSPGSNLMISPFEAELIASWILPPAETGIITALTGPVIINKLIMRKNNRFLDLIFRGS